MVSVTPRPLFTPGKEPVPIVQEPVWAPGPVWTGAENLTPTGIRSPDRPAAIPTTLPGPTTVVMISPLPDHEGNKLMFLSDWRVFPSAPCLARGVGWGVLVDSSRLDVVEIARVPDMLPSLFPS